MAAWSFIVHRYLTRELPCWKEPPKGHPPVRRLRVFTQDPSLGQLDGAISTLEIDNERLEPGPAGSYFVVVDSDRDHLKEYPAVDLDRPELLMRDGLDPSTTDRAFTCQMVYAVAMETYARFAQALGRNPGFGPIPHEDGRLRIVPRAFKDANAYYDREEGAVLLGWDHARKFAQGRSQPGGHVFLGLSHDVVAHEVSHALLDGLRPNFLRPTHPDVGALHEAFGDLVAVFLHFAQPKSLTLALERTQGSIEDDQLAAIGRQFGFDLLDGRNPLRTALRTTDLNERILDKDLLYDPRKEEHDLGSVLLSAVFEAYRRVYKRKTATLRRVFASYQGRLPAEGIELLAGEASRLAEQFLSILLRAIDYCPSHHCTFGEYLRAMITADFELVPQDPWAYRESLVTSFRRFGITVPDVMDLSERSLLWRPVDPAVEIEALRFERLSLEADHGQIDWGQNRESLRVAAEALGRAICNSEQGPQFGLVEPSATVLPAAIMSMRTLRRVAPDRSVKIDLVAEVVQKKKVREGYFFGGSTLVIDSKGRIRYAISKDLNSTRRLREQRAWLRDQPAEIREAAWAERSQVSAHLQRRIHLER
ncbi:MAG: hypothetical protein ABJC13_19360 [Acidobacteriota bacterium]